MSYLLCARCDFPLFDDPHTDTDLEDVCGGCCTVCDPSTAGEREAVPATAPLPAVVSHKATISATCRWHDREEVSMEDRVQPLTQSGLRFEKPPPDPRGGKLGVASMLVELREHPGRWARLPGDYTHSIQRNINAGLYAGVRKGEFECKSRGIDGSKRRHLWVRYVGLDDEDGEA